MRTSLHRRHAKQRHAPPASAGITITQVGPRPALIASGKITDPATGFSSTIDFPAPDLQLASAVHATGLPIGKPAKGSPYAGAGYFVPHVVARNLLATPQTVTITVEYPATGSATASSVAAASLPPDAADSSAAGTPPLQGTTPGRIIPRPPESFGEGYRFGRPEMDLTEAGNLAVR
ncbi:MAG: hypothetical protein ACRD06_03260 [Terriglobia bacterium]